MGYNQRKGFTLIELIIVIAILGVLAGAGTYLMFHLVQHTVFLPNQMNMDMLASDALDIMVEGDSQAKGLRFSRSITRARRYRVIFVNQDNQKIRYRFNRFIGRLYRSIDGGADELMPYYQLGNVSLGASGNRLFTYYDETGSTTTDPDKVRRIDMTLIAATGSGIFNEWEGESEQRTSVTVRKLQ